MPSSKLVNPEGELKGSLSFLEELPPICDKCHSRLVVVDTFCDWCYVEDEPDTDFFVEDHR